MHRRRLAGDDVGTDLVARAARVTVIEVSDNGVGIAAEDVDHVFDPFFTTKDPGKGTGLGLSICARLVEGMGGYIEAGNRPEGGARFVVRLPGMTDPDSTTVGPLGTEPTEAQ
jgi:signal transduction histidine kinase